MSSAIAALSSKLTLLTVGNPKIEKGTAKGYATAGLHLAPAWLSGHNTCAKHTPECAAACLNTSGRGAMGKVQAARLRRTLLYFEDRPTFLDQLNKDIVQFIANAKKENLEPTFRLNLTSDIRWENHGIPQAYPTHQFYDYFKVPNRRNIPVNYHLTFSFSGHNFKECEAKLKEGYNVAVPFKVMPSRWMGYPVVDGDETDLRFLDPPNSIIGLKLKGKLRQDTTSKFIGDNHPHLCEA